VDEAAVLADDVDDEGLAGVELRADEQPGEVEAVVAEHVGDGPSAGVAADPADDRGGHLHLRQVHGDVGRATADRQQDAVGHDQLALGGQVADRRADVVGDDDAGAQDIRWLGHEPLVNSQSPDDARRAARLGR
jgi:hypothetical protein